MTPEMRSNYFVELAIRLNRDGFATFPLKNGLGYLCHPAYLALSRHDKANNDNLLEICRTYLNNNMNVAQSAKLLYIHRNTMIRKLELAEEITGRDLNDSHFQHLMWISYQADDYAKNILHCDISSLNL